MDSFRAHRRFGQEVLVDGHLIDRAALAAQRTLVNGTIRIPLCVYGLAIAFGHNDFN